MRNWLYSPDLVIIPILAGLMLRWHSFGWTSVPFLIAGLAGWV